MKKILVLVDNSTPAANAAAYAAELARDRGIDELVLMANCFVPLFEQIVPSPDLIQVGATDIQTRMARHQAQLQELRTTVGGDASPSLRIRTMIGTQPLLRAVLEAVEAESPLLVVIGSSSRILTEDCSIGRQLIALARVIPVPVLVIPPEARFRPVDVALVSSATGMPSAIQSAVTAFFQPISLVERPLDKKDVLSGVLDDAAATNARLIVALPRKHSFFYQLTHENIMNAIVMNSTIPVLIWK